MYLSRIDVHVGGGYRPPFPERKRHQRPICRAQGRNKERREDEEVMARGENKAMQSRNQGSNQASKQAPSCLVLSTVVSIHSWTPMFRY